MPTLNINDMLGGVNVFGPNGLNTNLQQHQAAEMPTARPAAGAHGVWVERDPGVLNADVVTTADTAATAAPLVGHHHRIVSPMQEAISALEDCVGELDATNDDIYQKLDEHERRLSMNENQPEVAIPEVAMPEVDERETIISISKTNKTTEVVVSNSILESISNLVKKG